MNAQRRLRWISAIGAIAFVGYLLYSTQEHRKFRYEVCVTFAGRTHCATAEGQTAQEAIRAAQSIGCALLTNGRDENIQCLDAAPTRVRELD
jgi:hypothetical protein